MLRRPLAEEGYIILLENASATALTAVKTRESPEAKRQRLAEVCTHPRNNYYYYYYYYEHYNRGIFCY